MYSDLFNDYELSREYELLGVWETDIPGLYENCWGYKFCTPKYFKKYNIPYQIRGKAFSGYQKRLSNLTVFDLIYYGLSHFVEYDGGIARELHHIKIKILSNLKNYIGKKMFMLLNTTLSYSYVWYLRIFFLQFLQMSK
ncbi:hypothetical protein [Bacillus thuringiensis]|uniref:hypothetical protein n=1 Tax=Bacillus thuringiensis TaxID=1428 RepID=UPI00211D6027|nr:hypothetical protein [Bacillus thuringiensis]